MSKKVILSKNFFLQFQSGRHLTLTMSRQSKAKEFSLVIITIRRLFMSVKATIPVSVSLQLEFPRNKPKKVQECSQVATTLNQLTLPATPSIYTTIRVTLTLGIRDQQRKRMQIVSHGPHRWVTLLLSLAWEFTSMTIATINS